MSETGPLRPPALGIHNYDVPAYAGVRKHTPGDLNHG